VVAIGTKRTYGDDLVLSAFGGRADIGRCVAPVVSDANDPKQSSS
jgi:hypothetical protein